MKFKFGPEEIFYQSSLWVPISAQRITLCIWRMQGLNLVKNQAPPLTGVEHKNRKDNKTTELSLYQLSQNKLMNTHLKSLRITWFT